MAPQQVLFQFAVSIGKEFISQRREHQKNLINVATAMSCENAYNNVLLEINSTRDFFMCLSSETFMAFNLLSHYTSLNAKVKGKG